MPVITTPIVGAHFRPPAKQVLGVLPLGTPLILIPEPDNPYDEHAIKVLCNLRETYPIAQWVQLNEALEGTGFTATDLMRREEAEGPLHLGYIPATGARTCQGGPGNLEVASAIFSGKYDTPYTARLSTAPEGYPTITIIISESEGFGSSSLHPDETNEQES